MKVPSRHDTCSTDYPLLIVPIIIAEREQPSLTQGGDTVVGCRLLVLIT